MNRSRVHLLHQHYINKGFRTQFLEARSPAEFCSNMQTMQFKNKPEILDQLDQVCLTKLCRAPALQKFDTPDINALFIHSFIHSLIQSQQFLIQQLAVEREFLSKKWHAFPPGPHAMLSCDLEKSECARKHISMLFLT